METAVPLEGPHKRSFVAGDYIKVGRKFTAVSDELPHIGNHAKDNLELVLILWWCHLIEGFSIVGIRFDAVFRDQVTK